MEYSSSYYSTRYPDDAAVGAGAAALSGVMIVFMLFAIVFAIAMYVVSALLLGRIFKKAGVKPWIAWVPVYNTWKILEIGGQPGFWAIMAFLPIINIVALVFQLIAMYQIGLKLQKSGSFVLWAIFIPLVWLIWLAVDDSKWNETLGEKRRDTPEAPVQPPVGVVETVETVETK